MANKNTKKKAAIASVALLALGFGGIAVSGAYFTDEVTVKDNTLKAGTVQLGAIGAQDGTVVAFDNILPIATADVATEAEVATIAIQNTGTADINWAASITLPADATPEESALAGMVQYQLSTDGTTWSAPAAFGTATGFTAATAEVASQANAEAQVRLWLPETANNTYQAESLRFDLTARAIQAGSPTTQFADDSNFTPLYTP